MGIWNWIGGNRRSRDRTARLLEKSSMSSATDLTKAWLESLPTDVDEPTPSTRAPHRSTKSRTHDARDKDALALSSSASVHPLPRPQSRGDTNGHVKRHLAKVSASAQSTSGVAAGGGGGRSETSKNTDDELSDVDQAFDKLVGDFSASRESAEVGKKTKAEVGHAPSQPELEDRGKDRKTSDYLWIRPTVIEARTGRRKLPALDDGINHSNTRRERSVVDELAEEVREEREETAGSKRSDRNTRNQRYKSPSPSSRGPVKAFYEYKPQHVFSTQTPITASESNATKDSAFRKPSFRNSAASSADRTYQSCSRDFATQTFGQMVTTSTANSEAQTEISAVTNTPDDIILRNSLMNSREPVEEYLTRHSLGSPRRNANDVSVCRTNSSKSLHRSAETSKKSNSRLLNESFDDSVDKWTKKNVRSAENTAAVSDRFNVHSSKGTPADDTVSVKSGSLSGTSNSRQLMSLMLEEVKALKSFVQTHLDERQTPTNRTPTKQRLDEGKDPDSDSAVELGIVDKTRKERERSKHKSSKSGRRHSRHRRTEDLENEEGYRRSRRSPTRERTWDDIRRGPIVDDSRNRYSSMVDGRRQYVESVGASSSVYNTYPHGDNRPIHPSNYHPFIPANGLNPTAYQYQSPFQLYQNRNVAPFHGFVQPQAMPPPYQADLGHRFGGQAPMNTHPLMYNTMPAGHAFAQRVPFPNSVAIVPTVEPSTYHATVRPTLTFIPADVTPIGQLTTQSTKGAWYPRGQFITKDSGAMNPNDVGLVANELGNVRVRRNDPSTRSSFRTGHQPRPRKLMNSLNDALREAQGIRHLTERLGKDTQLTSY